MLFPEATRSWLLTRRDHIAPRTYADYGNHIKFLSGYFVSIALNDITGDMLRDYQRRRRQTVGPSIINRECGIVRQMRDRTGFPLTDYQPLPMPKDYESPGRALTDSEEVKLERIFKAAAGHPKWNPAALAPCFP